MINYIPYILVGGYLVIAALMLIWFARNAKDYEEEDDDELGKHFRH